MEVSRTSINLLKYVSGNGKKSILQKITPRKLESSDLSGLRYYPDAKYCILPTGTPLNIKLKNGILSYGVIKENLSNILNEGNINDFWLKLLEPKEKISTRIESEMEKLEKTEIQDKVVFLETFSSKEKANLSHLLANSKQILATITGHKPACFYESKIKCQAEKIKQNKKYKNVIDLVKLKNGGTFILNKPEVLKLIEENKDVYSYTQNLDINTDLETIYQTVLNNLRKGTLPECLFGMTLGFPRHSSMIYHLEQLRDKGSRSNLRNNVNKHKEKMLEILHSDRSPFKNLPSTSLSKLEKHITEMDEISFGAPEIYQFVKFGKENATMKRILDKENDFNNNFKIEDLF